MAVNLDLVALEERPHPTIDDFLTWLTVERGRAANTLAAYRRDLARYQAHLARRGTDGLEPWRRACIRACAAG